MPLNRAPKNGRPNSHDLTKALSAKAQIWLGQCVGNTTALNLGADIRNHSQVLRRRSRSSLVSSSLAYPRRVCHHAARLRACTLKSMLRLQYKAFSILFLPFHMPFNFVY